MIDRIDRRILDALQRSSAVTLEQIADLAGTSASAAQRRIRRLRLDGYIVGEFAMVEPRRLGAQIFIVQLEIERKRADLYASLQQWMKKCDNIQQAYNVTGTTDFVIVVAASSTEEYDDIMTELVEMHPNVKRFVTSSVLQTFKRSLFVPVAEQKEG